MFEFIEYMLSHVNMSDTSSEDVSEETEKTCPVECQEICQIEDKDMLGKQPKKTSEYIPGRRSIVGDINCQNICRATCQNI